jgi:hypothetical protein
MDRLRIYQGRTLLGVEFAPKPSSLAGVCKDAHVFERIGVTEIKKLAAELAGSGPQSGLSSELSQFLKVADARIKYWEQNVPGGSKCFVHHARLEDAAEGEAAYAQVRAEFPGLALIGLYRIDPSMSLFPEAFPVGAAPNMWRPGEVNVLTNDSLFFLNFFPQQPYLRELVYQGTIAIYSESSPGLYHANNYVDLVSDEFIAVRQVERMVAVNLNRYRDVRGFFTAASAGAAKTVIVNKGSEQFRWYGMLTRLI